MTVCGSGFGDVAHNLRYHPLFDRDFIEAANWYDMRSAGLGDAFSMNVARAVENLASDPTRFSPTLSGLRYCRVDRFPYVVLFNVINDEVFLLGVLHTARSYEKWRRHRE